MKNIFKLGLIVTLAVCLQACSKTEMEEIDNATGTPVNHIQGKPAMVGQSAQQYNLMPVYYGKDMYHVHYRTFTGAAATELLAQSPVVNVMYVYQPGVLSPEGTPFTNFATAVSVSPGKQIVWMEVEIKLNRGAWPEQYYTEEQLIRAVRNQQGMITLAATGTVYQGRSIDYKLQVQGGQQE